MADKFDAYYQGLAEADMVNLRFFTFGFDRSIGIRGPQKLVLQWLKRFMTTKGSDPTDSESGTDFPNLIGSNISSMADVRDVVLLAIEDCNSQMRKIQRVTMPDEDEMLSTATLTAFQTTGEDGFDAWVTIRNVKGAELAVNLPSIGTSTT